MRFLDHILPAAALGIALAVAGCKATTTATTNTVHTYSSNAAGIALAKRMNGLHERKHTRAIRAVVRTNPRRVPWCGYFNAAVARKQGLRPPKGYPRASSWTRWGKRVSKANARPGDHIIRRGRGPSGYHTGVIVSVRKGVIRACSGNDSNRVRCRAWPRFTHIRRGTR